MWMLSWSWESNDIVDEVQMYKKIGGRIDKGGDKMPLVASAMEALGLALTYKSKCLA